MMNVETVGIAGAGTMGSGIAHVFARAGMRVILCDVEQNLLDRALSQIRTNLGREAAKGKLAESEVEALARDFQPDVVFESVGGTANTVEQGIQAVRPGGRVVVLGLFMAPSHLDMRTLLMKEVMLTGSKVYGMSDHGHEFAAAVQMLPRYASELALLQTHQFSLAELPSAFAAAADKASGAVKVTVLP